MILYFNFYLGERLLLRPTEILRLSYFNFLHHLLVGIGDLTTTLNNYNNNLVWNNFILSGRLF